MQYTQHTYFLRLTSATVGVAFALAFGPVLASAQNADVDDADDAETSISGSALERASEAALDYVGEGRVTDTEADDEEGTYEVEVTRDDGTQVDVHLDEDFDVINTEEEDAGEDTVEDELEDESEDTNVLGEDGALNVAPQRVTPQNTSQQNTSQEEWESVRLQFIQLLQQLIALLQA